MSDYGHPLPPLQTSPPPPPPPPPHVLGGCLNRELNRRNLRNAQDTCMPEIGSIGNGADEPDITEHSETTLAVGLMFGAVGMSTLSEAAAAACPYAFRWFLAENWAG